MKKVEVGILYLSLHNLLKKTVGINRTMSQKDFYSTLGRHFLIPKNLRYVVVKEMEERELIERVEPSGIRILNFDIDIEEDTGKIYRMAGLF